MPDFISPSLCAGLALATPAGLLAWRPFLDPIPLHDWWWVLIFPLSLGIAITYKAVRVGDFSTYWRQVAVLTVQIVGGMALLGFAAFLFVETLIPMLAPMPE